MIYRHHMISILLAGMLLLTLSVCWAEDTNPQTSADQNEPAVSQDSQTAEGEATAEAVPELFIPEKSHQFENVAAGQTITHDYILYNKGTAPLNITRVKTG